MAEPKRPAESSTLEMDCFHVQIDLKGIPSKKVLSSLRRTIELVQDQGISKPGTANAVYYVRHSVRGKKGIGLGPCDKCPESTIRKPPPWEPPLMAKP